MKKTLCSFIAAGAIALSGCSSLQLNSNSVIVENGQKSNVRGEIYSSPVILADYGFKILNKLGEDIDESAYPQEKGGKTYIVGYSSVYASEVRAREESELNAQYRALKLTGNNKAFVIARPMEYETYQLEKEGKRGYAVHSLNEIEFLK